MRAVFALMILGMIVISAIVALGLMLYMLGFIGH
jgi:hypothetical protein